MPILLGRVQPRFGGSLTTVLLVLARRLDYIFSMNPNDVHRITRGEMEHICKCLRFIDQARKALAAKGPGTEAIVTELQKSTDGINDVLKDLPRVEEAD